MIIVLTLILIYVSAGVYLATLTDTVRKRLAAVIGWVIPVIIVFSKIASEKTEDFSDWLEDKWYWIRGD